MIETGRRKWEIEIKKDGTWPTVWSWSVYRRDGHHTSVRLGQCFTRDGASRRVAKARLSMERDDVQIDDAA